MQNHICNGSFKSINGHIYLDCREGGDGVLTLEVDKSMLISVPFCPICGKESQHHARLINQETVRMGA